MKNKKILPFAFSALVAALSGCGGESANVIPEKYDTSTENGACFSNTAGCVEFVLDYPFDGLNFTCSSDTKNKFITLFDPNESVSTGACKIGDTVTFYLMGDEDKKIDLGKVDLSTISNVASSTSPPRLTLLDIAAGINVKKASELAANDSTVKVAMRITKIIQAIGLKDGSISSATDIQPVYMNDKNRIGLESIAHSITASDFINKDDDAFNALFSPWLDLNSVSDADALTAVSKLANISAAAVFQPEFALFSTSQALFATVNGSNGLVGCDNATVCDPNDTKKINSFGHFMLMTDRQGMTFGSGLQWRGQIDTALTTIGGVNLQMMKKVKPKQMTATQQDTWIDPITHEIDRKRILGFKFDVNEENAEPLTIKQGTLLADKMIAGAATLYRALAGLPTSAVLTAEDNARLGRWTQRVNGVDYYGTLDLYKQYPISYLDKSVFKTEANTAAGQNYFFPLYADMTFEFTNTDIKTVKLGIVIDSNGDIRTNIHPNVPADAFTNTSNAIVDLSTAADGCQSDVLEYPELMQDSTGTQQYRIGTVSRTFISSYKANPNALSLRMILADQALGTLNGALIGMNTTIKTSTDSSTSIVVGGALLKVDNLINAADGTKPSTITFKDSGGNAVKWANSFASFNSIYNQNNTADTESKELAKLAGGSISFDLAPCYTVKKK